MCGRFALQTPFDVVARLLAGEPVGDAEWAPSFNIAPTDPAPVARVNREGVREVAPYRWGLIPFWAKDARVGARMINARSETIAKKPAFRDAFAKRRCLVPASGFFEWTVDPNDKKKQPHWIHLPDSGLMVFAGLYAGWNAPDGARVRSFTIITVPANAAISELHDRMPAVLDAEARERWLDPTETPDTLQALLQPWDGPIAHVKVAKTVNNVRSEGPELIVPLDEQPAPGNLELVF